MCACVCFILSVCVGLLFVGSLCVFLCCGCVGSLGISLIKLGLEVMGLCSELSLKNRIIGSEAVTRECKNYEETKDWRFMNSFQDAMAALN